MISVSIVIPVYNEKDSIPILANELTKVISSIEGYNFEVIFVDDGSTDNSEKAILESFSLFQKAVFIRFEENAGQTDAFDAGFKAACGDVIITMDADLQNDPSDIPKLLQYAKYYDVVCGIRANRRDSWKRQFSSKVANAIRRMVTGDKIKDIGCSLKAYNADLIKKIKVYKGMHRFFPVLLEYEGAKIIQVFVNHRPRRYGEAKYNIKNRIFKSLIDLFAVLWMKRRRLNYKIAEIKRREQVLAEKAMQVQEEGKK